MKAAVPYLGRVLSLLTLAGFSSPCSRAQDLVDAHSGQVVSHDFGRTWIDSGPGRGGSQQNFATPPVDPRVQRGLGEEQQGVAQLNAGNLDAAIALLWDAVNDMPGNQEAARALGAAQNRKGLESASAGSWAEATDYFGYALEQCPGDQEFLKNLRNAAINRGRQQEAREARFAVEWIEKDWASLGQELSGAGLVKFPAAAPELMGAEEMGRAARKEAEEAEAQAAKNGSQLPGYEPAAAEAGQVFDTRGFWSGEIKPIKLHGLAPPPSIDYTAGPFREDGVIQSALKEQHEALAQKAKAQLELAGLHATTAARVAKHEDAAEMDAKEAELRQTIGAADSAAARKGEVLRKRARFIHFHVGGFSEEPQTNKPEAAP